jgi:hypothetical protein
MAGQYLCEVLASGGAGPGAILGLPSRHALAADFGEASGGVCLGPEVCLMQPVNRQFPGMFLIDCVTWPKPVLVPLIAKNHTLSR